MRMNRIFQPLVPRAWRSDSAPPGPKIRQSFGYIANEFEKSDDAAILRCDNKNLSPKEPSMSCSSGWSRREVLSAAALSTLALHIPLQAAGADSRRAALSGPLKDTATKGVMVWRVAGLDYLAEEYLLSGVANIYRPVSMADAPDVASRDNVKDLGAREFSRQVLEADQPFTTRLIVYRPKAKSKFSGNVILESLHPNGGGSSLAWNTLHSFFSANGDAYVGVQHPLTFGGLKTADPARYGELATKDATQLWGMLAQAGAAIKLEGRGSPLRGYGVRHVILTGYSYTGVAA